MKGQLAKDFWHLAQMQAIDEVIWHVPARRIRVRLRQSRVATRKTTL